MITIDLYTASDIAKVRELLLKEQGGYDAVTGLLIPEGKAVLDHAHDDEQLVRGVLHRQINAFEGKVRNSYDRLIKWWCPYELHQLLRLLADYLEKANSNPDSRYRHNHWQKKLRIIYNKLNAAQQNNVLIELGYTRGSNPKQRKDLFAKAVLNRNLGYNLILKVLTKE